MSRTTLNARNLETLGAECLAALVMELVQGSAALQRRARLALSAAQGPAETVAAIRKGRVSEVVEIGWRRNLRVNQHPPNRRRQPPGRSRHEAEYRQLVLFATA